MNTPLLHTATRSLSCPPETREKWIYENALRVLVHKVMNVCSVVDYDISIVTLLEAKDRLGLATQQDALCQEALAFVIDNVKQFTAFMNKRNVLHSDTSSPPETL